MSDTDRIPLLPSGEPTRSYEDIGTVRPNPWLAAAPLPATEPSHELQALLRRRLTLIAVIGLCCSLVLTAILTPFLIAEENWDVLACFWVLVLLPAAGTALLRSRPSLSLRSLRALELATLAVLVGVLVWSTYSGLVRDRLGSIFAVLSDGPVNVPRRPLLSGPHGIPTTYRYTGFTRFMWGLAGWQNMHWSLLLVGYGLFMPNTWRCATVVLTMLALLPVVLHGIVCLIDPDISWFHTGVLMLGTVAVMTFVAAMVIFGAHRIESLRREVLAARRLGQYQLKELLGAGGMGEVYRAEHLLLRRPCAIKLIRPERAGDPRNLRRFEREVQATATLTNWHTVEIYDFGHAADGTFYYVMEYLPGLTLEQLVSRHGPLPPERAIHLLRQVCGALREAHAIGLIHRDIKPGNIIVGQRGGLPDVAKLLDFGLVRAPGPADPQEQKLTQWGSLLGTPAYMSPEQATGAEDVTACGDIYSLGAVAYFLLTGRPPFVGKSAVQVLAAHLHERVRPLTDLRGDLPADVDTVVLRRLEKDPPRRFQSVEDLEQALARCGCAGRWDRAQAAAWWQAHRGNNGER